MAELLNPRIPMELKEMVEEYAGSERTVSDTSAQLIEIGIAVRESDAEPKITGPFSLPRPFAEINFGGRMMELRTEVEEDVADRLVEEFDNKPNTAAREALRLGIFTVAGDRIEIEGPVGGPRPFAKIEVESVDDQNAKDMIKELRGSL
jgi:hypothetical protein